jgi:MFS family permease
MLILATNTFFCTGFFGPSMAIMSACAPQGTKGSTMALNLVFSVLGPLAIIQIVGGLLSQNMMKDIFRKEIIEKLIVIKKL